MKITKGYYDREYWEDGTKSGYTKHSFFRGDHLHQAKALSLTTAYGGDGKWLVAGCARGWAVEQLCNIGVDAYGFDISKWAIKHSPEELSDRLIITDGLKRKVYDDNIFDVVATFETTEHIAENDIGLWLENIYFWMKDGGHFLATICTGHNTIRGIDDNDLSHQTLRNRLWWENLLEETGFIEEDGVPDRLLDIEVTTKERTFNLFREMGWHIFAWQKPAQ
jgi:cyclopropane fatty-acyl-phospholipid synthase-like methyltransferase